MRTVTVSGHRGAPESAPENTLSSFRAAVDAGVDILETDVRLSADGHVVVSHDADFSRLGGPSVLINQCTREELAAFRLVEGPDGPEKPLFMDEALDQFPDMFFNVDLKDRTPHLVRAWHRLLVESGAGERCRTASFHQRSLSIYASLDPAFSIGVSQRGIIGLLLRSLIGLARKPRPGESVLQVPEKSGIIRVLSPRTIKLWHRYGWKIEAWTIDNEKDIRRLISWGVDGIITNRPSLMKDRQKFVREDP